MKTGKGAVDWCTLLAFSQNHPHIWGHTHYCDSCRPCRENNQYCACQYWLTPAISSTASCSQVVAVSVAVAMTFRVSRMPWRGLEHKCCHRPSFRERPGEMLRPSVYVLACSINIGCPLPFFVYGRYCITYSVLTAFP